jgi:hypothetical protein
MPSDLYLIRKNQQWVKYSAVHALSVTGAATTDEIEVWSSEFRDIFTPIGAAVGQTSATGTIPTMTGLTVVGPTVGTTTVASGVGTISNTTVLSSSIQATNSDEIAHEGLRQTKLPRTAWKFDFGAAVAPRYIYAFIELGDIIANNPPETA